MSAPVVTIFSNTGGVGRTSLVHHLSWMYADLGLNVLAADLDPQSNLSATFLGEGRLEELWPEGEHGKTIYGAVKPMIDQLGDIADEPYAEEIDERIHLLVGDLALSGLDDELSLRWPMCLEGSKDALRVVSAFWRVMRRAAKNVQADIVLVDLGPNLGAINRSALLATDYLVVPLVLDLFTLRGLKSLGPAIVNWRKEWKDRLQRNPVKDLELPEGKIEPMGYVMMQHAEKLGRLAGPSERWAKRVPEVYSLEILGKKRRLNDQMPDSSRLGLIRHYRTLMFMADEARKPVFHLLPADGAIGSHLKVVQEARNNFQELALEIARRCNAEVPASNFNQ